HAGAGEPERLDVAANHCGRPWIRLDERRVHRSARQGFETQCPGPRVQIEHCHAGEVQSCAQCTEQRLAHPVAGGPGALRRHGDAASSGAARDDPGQLTTISRSPPSTCAVRNTAIRAMVPALGAVIAASIFIASIVATVWPAVTSSPSETATVTT